MEKLIKDLFSNWKTIPNLLSFIRILIVPVIAVLYVKSWTQEGNSYLVAAVLLVALSGLTDLFDGKIARRFNQVSNLGKVLDPIADKATIITIAILLLIQFRSAQDPTIRAFGWVFLVFLCKDAFMIVGGALMIALGIRPGAAEIFGKISTVIFYTVVLLVIAFGKEIGVFSSLFTLPPVVMGILICIAAIATLVGFASYVPGIRRQAKERFSKENKGKNIIIE